MSYEGYEQHICENGHYFTCDALFMFDTRETTCPHCQSKSAWVNAVDETNADGVGYIPEETLKEKFLIKEAEYKTCNLNCEHLISPAVFRIPTKEETKPLETYRKNDEAGSLYLCCDDKEVGQMWYGKIISRYCLCTG